MRGSNFIRRVSRKLSGLAAPWERSIIRKHTVEPIQHPPIFILGPPRTGTTLLFQLATSCFQTTYFRNLATDWAPEIPLLVQKLSRLMGEGKKQSYRSSYGRARGIFAQAEGSQVLARWFPHQHPSFIEPISIPLGRFHGFRDSITAMTNECSLPFVCKNAWNCFRLGWLAELFPTAVFVVVRRNIVHSAQSDLEARINVKGDKNAWNSASPREHESISRKPYWEQVVDQQYFTWQQIHRDRERLGPERFVEIWYENLCKDPAAELKKVQALVSSQGGTLQTVECDLSGVKLSVGRKVDDDDYDRIATYAEKYGPEWAEPS